MKPGIDIKGIFENLQKATQNEVKSMSEGAFKELFLPMFLDQKSNPHSLVLANWVQFAGSPFMPVNVLDDKGNIVFVVPPISNRDALANLGNVEASGRPLKSLDHVLNTYSLLMKTGPGVAENYIDAEFTKRFSLMRTDEGYMENYEAWRKIFERYGHGSVVSLKNEAKPLALKGEQFDEIEPLD